MNKQQKVFLVTWIGDGNYGTSLQSFALFYKLKQHNYDVTLLLDARGNNVFKRFLRYLLYLCHLYQFVFGKKNKTLKLKKLISFQNRNISIYRVFLNIHLCSIVNNQNIFITGSDQIWNTHYHYSPFMFLDFAKSSKRVAYASSIGTNEVAEKYKENVKNHLLKFCHIGVREATAVQVLKTLTGRNDIVQVLDPTFLLTKDDWMNVAKDATYEMELPSRFILCYLIGNNKWYKEDVEDVKYKTGIENVLIIPSEENPTFNVEGAFVYKNASVAEFVDLINKSSFVCTDSFHATALSINLNKSFVEFLRFKDTDSASQNSRIYDMLGHYHLEKRLFSHDNSNWKEEIDYTIVNPILDNDRIFSEEYLFNSIDN